MIKPPSLLAEYTLIYSGDPALTLPADPEERDRKLAECRETGQWHSLITGSELPTLFTVRPLTGSQLDWWAGEVSRQRLVQTEAAALALRLALRKVDNFGSHKVSLTRFEGQHLATTEIIDAIYSEGGGEGRSIVVELANLVIERAQTAPRPKS